MQGFDHGGFGSTPHKGTLQHYTPVMARSDLASASEVSRVIRPDEHRFLRHHKRHGNPRVSAGLPSEPRNTQGHGWDSHACMPCHLKPTWLCRLRRTWGAFLTYPPEY